MYKYIYTCIRYIYIYMYIYTYNIYIYIYKQYQKYLELHWEVIYQYIIYILKWFYTCSLEIY